MKDEEFKRKLEYILENLYKIDREIEKYFKERHADVENGGYWRKSYSENYSTRSCEGSSGK